MSLFCTFRNRTNQVCRKTAEIHLFRRFDIEDATEIDTDGDYQGISLCPEHYNILKQVYNFTR